MREKECGPWGAGEEMYHGLLLDANPRLKKNVAHWLLERGAEYGSMVAWWRQDARNSPHEGIDLYRYQDLAGRVRQLAPGFAVPAARAGRVGRVLADFLGATVWVEHGPAASGALLFSAYGHLRPEPCLVPGRRLEAGEVLGEIADCRGHRAGIAPHLHLSIGVVHGMAVEDLDWPLLADRQRVTLCDPLLLGLRHFAG